MTRVTSNKKQGIHLHFLCHSRAGGNRAWVVISYLIWGIIQRYIFYSPAIRNINLIAPISSLSTPPQPPTKIAFSWGPVSRHPSNGGELGTFPPRSNFPFTTDGAVTPIPSRNKVLLYGRIWLLPLVLLRSKVPSAEGWHEVPGWSNATAQEWKELQ